jgi:hypothetical protein
MASDIERPKRLVTLRRDDVLLSRGYRCVSTRRTVLAAEGVRRAAMEDHQRQLERERHDAPHLLGHTRGDSAESAGASCPLSP